MNPKTLAALRRGTEAGLIASVPQVLGTQLAERLLRLPTGAADIGPRLIQRLGALFDEQPTEQTRWLGASIFHFGYAAGWGALYALAHSRRSVPPVIGGLTLSGTIYAVAFTRRGVATRTRTEPPPERRGWRRELLLLTPPLIFGLGTALLYGRGPRPGEEILAEEIMRDPLRQREARTSDGRPARHEGELPTSRTRDEPSEPHAVDAARGPAPRQSSPRRPVP